MKKRKLRINEIRKGKEKGLDALSALVTATSAAERLSHPRPNTVPSAILRSAQRLFSWAHATGVLTARGAAHPTPCQRCCCSLLPGMTVQMRMSMVDPPQRTSHSRIQFLFLFSFLAACLLPTGVAKRRAGVGIRPPLGREGEWAPRAVPRLPNLD
jgi:hypothetical protein